MAQQSNENDKPFLIECEAEGEPAPKYVSISDSIFVFFVDLCTIKVVTYLKWEKMKNSVYLFRSHFDWIFDKNMLEIVFNCWVEKSKNGLFTIVYMLYLCLSETIKNKTQQSCSLVLCPIFKPKVASQSHLSLNLMVSNCVLRVQHKQHRKLMIYLRMLTNTVWTINQMFHNELEHLLRIHAVKEEANIFTHVFN